jgi:hypothetical protein
VTGSCDWADGLEPAEELARVPTVWEQQGAAREQLLSSIAWDSAGPVTSTTSTGQHCMELATTERRFGGGQAACCLY